MSGIPVAVAPTVRTPGTFLTVDLLAGGLSPGSQPARAIIMAPKGTSGTLTADTEIRLIASDADAATAWGTGTPGHLSWKAWYAKCPDGICYGVAPAESGGVAASGTLTFDDASPVTSARTVRIKIAGRTIEVPWAASEAKTVIAARVVTYLGLRTNDLPVSAADSGAGVVTCTFKVKGPWGNDCAFTATLVDGAGGSVVASGSGKLASGTTEPDFTNALSAMQNQEWAFIVACVSNADAIASSSTSNPGRIKTKINALNTGRAAKLQVVIIGCTDTSANVKAGAIAKNDPAFEYIWCQAGEGLPCELAAEEAGDTMTCSAKRANWNRIGRSLSYYGASDKVTNTPSDPTIEDLLWNGVTPIAYNAAGDCVVVRPITTHSQTSTGSADDRVLDMAQTLGAFAISRDVKAALPEEFKEASLSKDLEPTDEPPPAGVVEERDVKAFLVERMRFWVGQGVARKDKVDAAIANGTLLARVNPSDETQCDVVIPFKIVPPLAKFSVVAQKL